MGKILKNKKGFTLIELLAVVVILAIIGAIAMGAISGIIQGNRVDSAIATLNSVDEAAALACAQDGDLSNIEDYVDDRKGAVKVENINGGYRVTFISSEYKNVTGDNINDKMNKFKGRGTYDTADGKAKACSYPSGSTTVSCTIKYKCTD